MRYLIIGGGVAGTTAAESLRKLDADAEITLVSQEQHALYSRVLLPHFMKGKVERERVFLKKPQWYWDQKIEWLPGVVVESIDPKNKFVACSDGREYPYDKLLITTGGDVRVLDEDLRGVSYFRTLDDADHFLQLVAEQGSDAKGLVYGGGFIACEYVNLFRHFEIPMMLAHRGAHFWTKILNEEAGALITSVLEEGGVSVVPNAAFEGLAGTSELTGVVTSAGTHEATIAGVGIGLAPDYGWLRDAGIEVNVGIRTNEFLETNIPDVYAAGDVAEFFDPIVKRHLYIGNWMNAMSQGRTVAKTMTGEKTAVHLVSSYATNILGFEMIFIGDVEKAAADTVHQIGSKEAGGITLVYERNGAIVGAALLNRNTDRAVLTKAIKDQEAFSSIELT